MSLPRIAPATIAVPFRLHRLGIVMTSDPGNSDEAWGVLNPACCRDRDGTLLLFPRIVAVKNFSRIGLARVRFAAEEPIGVERLGYALEPTEDFERNATTAGVEDPRVVYVAALDRFVMTYTAFGPCGPRVALAVSRDAHTWERLGPIGFANDPRVGVDFNRYHNKDALLFPAPVSDPAGRPALALIHRPDYTVLTETGEHKSATPTDITETRPSMWISYTPLAAAQGDIRALTNWSDHRLLATPEQPWEAQKIGGGAPPILTALGWLVLYHGVGPVPTLADGRTGRPPYAAGVLILDRDDPRRVLYRSPAPILEPDTAAERLGTVDNVVFPTAVDPRDAGRIDVYYGMADARIGVARLNVPATLPG